MSYSLRTPALRVGLRCVAEGIETQEQLRLITEAGCDSAQGFFLSRPLEPDAVAKLLR